MQENIYIYYTNDLHSNFDQWPRVASYLKSAKEKRRQFGESCFIADIGDHADRVHPITEATRGKANVHLLNESSYDVVTLGNNEGLTLAHEDLYQLYDNAQFQVVCANLHSLADDHPSWLKPSVQLTSMQGVRVAFIGLTVPFNDYYELLQWHVSDPYVVLEKEISQVKENADVIVLLSHLGLSEDQEIARRFSDIDVIIGAHTHHLLRTGETINNTIITAAGKQCLYIGEVILRWDHTEKRLVSKEAYTTEITHIEKDAKTVRTLEKLEADANEKLGQPIIELTERMPVDWHKDTAVMQQLTDVMKKWTNADIAMLNSGVLLDEIPAGTVTYKDIHRICPHPINPCVVEVTGDELMEIIRASYTTELTELQLKGFGFRGKVIGRMIFSGIKAETQMNADGNEIVHHVQYKGETLANDQTYTLAVADTFTFGRLLPEVAKSKMKRYYVPEFLRDLLAYMLENYNDKSGR